MAEEFKRLSKLDYGKWPKNSENWATMLAELRTAIVMAQRQVNTRTARAKELMTSGHRDSLMSQMTILEDLTDLETTVTDTYVNTLKDNNDPETLTTIEVEAAASKNFATTTETVIKAATRVVKTVSDKLDERLARDHRVAHRAQSQEALDGQHHSDPPNKVNVASDLKPEQLCDTISQLDLDDWCERAEVYAEASNIINQTNSVQLGYLQALIIPNMWNMYKEYCEAHLILPTDNDFEKGLELLRETYYKKNDMFLLKLKTSADTFRGKNYSELQTWFFKYRQKARNCGLSTMSEEELFNFKLLASMTEKMKTTLFVQYARPSLQETLDFIDNQVIVENMSQTPTKMADTVNNIVDDTEKPTNVKCWVCNGDHRRQDCTADKKSLYCRRCKFTGHATEACRGRRRPTRSPSRSGWSTRSPSPSTSSSAESEAEEKRRRKKKEKEKKRRSREEKKSKNRVRQGASSQASTSASRSRSNSRGKAGRTTKPRRKNRDTVNNLEEDNV